MNEISMKTIALPLMMLSLVACGPDGPAERLGEGIDEAIEDAGYTVLATA